MAQTTISVSPETLDRLSELKPYDSISYDEFLTEMAGIYAEQRDEHPNPYLK